MQKIMFNDRYGLTQAVIKGRKTVTRRIIKAPKRMNGYDTNGFIVCQDIATHEVTGIYVRCYDGGTIDDIEILPKYEQWITEYLKGKDYTSPTEIGRAHAQMFGIDSLSHHSAWASPICKRMVEKGLLIRNDKGHYKLNKR